MKIKVGDIVYDSIEEPLMVILTSQDKENIKNMLPECTKYCVFNEDSISVEELQKWMDI